MYEFPFPILTIYRKPPLQSWQYWEKVSFINPDSPASRLLVLKSARLQDLGTGVIIVCFQMVGILQWMLIERLKRSARYSSTRWPRIWRWCIVRPFDQAAPVLPLVSIACETISGEKRDTETSRGHCLPKGLLDNSPNFFFKYWPNLT